MPLDERAVQRIASLARLRLEKPEAAQLETEIGAILAWIAQLDEVDVAGVAPFNGAVAMPLKMRDDVVNDGGDAAAALGNAPDRVGDFYAVPKVME